MLPTSVFEYQDYKAYLRNALSSSGEGRGKRTKLAEALGCNVGFVSQVFNGDSHFSLEYGVQVADFISLKGEERNYFLLLLHLAKAGSVSLRRYYEAELKKIRDERGEIRSRVARAKSLSETDYAIYYGNWAYAAIHMALSIPKFQSLSALASKFSIPEKQVRAVLVFLKERGLIVQEGRTFKTGPTRIHLHRESPMIAQHHVNWRMEALKSLSTPSDDDLHYSSVMTLTKKDALRIREVLLKSLSEVEHILEPSANEELFSLGIDFFQMS